MALRIEDLSETRNISILQTLNRLNWKSPLNHPDLNDRLTMEETEILKQQRGETYNGPYLPPEEFTYTPIIEIQPLKFRIIQGDRNDDALTIAPKLSEKPEKTQAFPQNQIIYTEAQDKGEYYSNGDKI